MKRLIALILAMLMMMAAFVACGAPSDDSHESATNEETNETTAETEPEAPKVVEAYACRVQDGAEEDTSLNTYMNAILYLWSDGKLEMYVGAHKGDEYASYKNEGRWSHGDEGLTFSYMGSDGNEYKVEDVEVVDNAFETRGLGFGMSKITTKINFFKIAYVDLEGDTYIGFLRKSLSMGDFVYSYVINLKNDGTFTLSNNFKNPFGQQINGLEKGTYTVADGKLSVKYDVVTDGDDDGVCEQVIVADMTAEFEGFLAQKNFQAGFYVGQKEQTPSLADFIYIQK